MPDASEPLTAADPADLAAALAFALRYQGRKRVHNADQLMAEIVAGRLVPPNIGPRQVDQESRSARGLRQSPPRWRLTPGVGNAVR